MSILSFSDAAIDRLPFHRSRRTYRDRALCGLVLVVGKRTKSFYVHTTCKRQGVRVGLGRFPLISTDEARSEALGVLKDIRKGILPAPRKSQPAASITVLALLDEYLKAKGLKQKTEDTYRSLLRTHFKEWQERPYSLLGSPAFASAWKEKVATLGSARGQTARALLSALLRYANAMYGTSVDDAIKRLAAVGVKPGAVKARTRMIEEDQQGPWFKAVEQTPEDAKLYLTTLALTGVRKEEGASIQRQDIDLERRTLYVRETKTDKPYTVPIGRRLAAMFKEYLGTLQGDTLFAGLSTEHVNNLATRRGSPQFSPHDLRRGFLSVASKLGINDRVVKRLVNHADKDVTGKHYVVLGVEDLRESMEKIEDWFYGRWEASSATN